MKRGREGAATSPNASTQNSAGSISCASTSVIRPCATAGARRSSSPWRSSFANDRTLIGAFGPSNTALGWAPSVRPGEGSGMLLLAVRLIGEAMDWIDRNPSEDEPPV